MKLRLVTVHPFDPWGTKIGGIENLIRSMIHHAPDDICMEVIGVTENPALRPPRQWSQKTYGKKVVSFYPVFPVAEPNRRTWIPLFAKFPLKLRGRHRGDLDTIYLYHRVEPLALTHISSKKSLLFMHGNPNEIVGRSSEVKWKFLPALYRRVEAKAVAKADSVWVVSRNGQHTLQERYPERADRCHFLPTCFRDDIFSLSSKEEREQTRIKLAKKNRLNADARFILFVGRWEQQKNPFLTLDAFKLVFDRYPNAYLAMIGTGGLQAEIEKKIREMKMEKQVLLPGPLPPETLAGWMKGAACLLSSSTFEGLPITLLEAQARGVPVVTTDTGEARQVIQEGKTGRIAPTPSANWLAKGVLDILKHPERYDPRECANAVEPYRPETVLHKWFDHVRKIAVMP